MEETVPFPIVIAKEGKWFVASCPIIDVATQGKTEKEVKENMKDLISEYFKDKDTPKPLITAMRSVSISLTSIPIKIPEGVHHSRTQTSASA